MPVVNDTPAAVEPVVVASVEAGIVVDDRCRASDRGTRHDRCRGTGHDRGGTDGSAIDPVPSRGLGGAERQAKKAESGEGEDAEAIHRSFS
jgi:hypothetical protein